MQTHKKQNIILLWLYWHFYEVPNFLLGVWKDYALFALNYFSVPTLLGSLFAPWRKYKWNYPKGLNVGEFFNTLISNTVSRILGAIMRVVLIMVAIVFQIFVIISGFIIFLLWIIIPFVISAGLLFVFIY